MIYRHKVILGVLQKFGKLLPPLEFQHVLLLFSKSQNEPSFEFVPADSGPFSFQAQADKQAMIEEGLLANKEEWAVTTDEDYTKELTKRDSRILSHMYEQYGDISQEDLIKDVAQIHPYYQLRNSLIRAYATELESKMIDSARPDNSDRKIYTIGYEGRPAEVFMNELFSRDISVLIDVRNNSSSRKFGFSKKKLNEMCEAIDIKFIHIPELGIEPKKRKNLKTAADYQRLFEEYENEILPEQQESLKKIYELFEDNDRVALMCYENNPEECHRHKISNKLEKDYDAPIEHIFNATI